MAIDLKLMKWIRENRLKFTRTEIIEKLKKEGHPEQDIVDSYEEIVKREPKGIIGMIATEPKSMVATIVLSIFFPGAGHIYLGDTGTGLTILILYIVGYLINFTIVGMIIGIPLIIAMWLWGLIGAIKRCDEINKGGF